VFTAPATPYKFAAFIKPNPMYAISEAGFGLCLRESGTGKLISAGIRGFTTSTRTTVRKNTNPTSFASNVADSDIVPMAAGFFVRVGADGTLVTAEFSFDGVNWFTALSEAKATFFTTAPNEVGIVSMLNTTGLTVGASYLSLVQS
jgi:hypothetical protein